MATAATSASGEASEYLGYYFAIGNDFLYFNPELFFVQHDAAADIAISIDPPLQGTGSVGRVHFAWSAPEGKIHLDPREGVCSLERSRYDFESLDSDSAQARSHREAFGEVFERHPIGSALRAVYGGAKPDPTIARHVGERLAGSPSLQTELLRMTGPAIPLPHPYWHAVEEAEDFLTTVLANLRDADDSRVSQAV